MTEARLTHHDPLAGQVAATVNKLCRSLIQGVAWDDAVRHSGNLADRDRPGNNGGFAPDVLRAAVFFVGTSACFAEALERSLTFAGPANYCPVLVGAIGGARWGASAIHPSLLIHVDNLPILKSTADTLASGWAMSGRRPESERMVLDGIDPDPDNPPL